MSGTTRAPDAGTTGVEDVVKDFWTTRPRRPRRGRKIAGVAAGIANRYRIDPALVRVGLVVAAVYGGAGILVYLLGWLFLPEQDDEVSPVESMVGRGRSSTSTGFTLLLCLALVPTFSWLVNGFFPGYFGLLVVGGLLYLLHRNRGHLGPAPAGTGSASSVPPPAEPAAGPTVPLTTVPLTTVPPVAADEPAGTRAGAPGPAAHGPGEEPEPEPTTPPAWDPLGAAPFAWDLPDPTPPQQAEEPEPPKRRRSRVGVVTVGIALIVAAGLSMAVGGWVTPQHVVGVVLAVLGLGMVAGSFLRGGRGLVWLAVPLAVVGFGLTVVVPDGLHGFGEIDARPTSTAQVDPAYRKSGGSIQLDLTRLPSSGSVTTRIDLGMGDVSVVLPRTADVRLTCVTEFGSVSCLDESRAGISDNDPGEIVDDGSDGPGGLEVDMVVEVGAGSVDVRRG